LNEKLPRESNHSRNGGPGGKRYSLLDCFSGKDIGKTVTVTLVNGRTESGILRDVGMFDIKLELPIRRELIVFKHSIITVSVL
jgi:sRNA-binding regulator protein Hfq